MKMQADAVFAGGGIKVLGILGALTEAERRGYTWVNVAGTSAGAIIASLIAAGYSAGEIKTLMRDLDFSMLKDKCLLNRVPLLGPALSLWFESGLHAGNYLEGWIKRKLAAKNVKTFSDLIITEYSAEPKFRYKLVIIAADVTKHKLLRLPNDIIDYGINPDKLEVSKAVRMSFSLPFFYKPYKLPYSGRSKKRNFSSIIDGGLLSNFPVWIFDSDATPAWPTFGFKMVDSEEPLLAQGNNPLDLFKDIISTVLEAHDLMHEADPKNRVRTISIPSIGIKTTDFKISNQLREKLYQTGIQSAVSFFENWDFETVKLLYFNKT